MSDLENSIGRICVILALNPSMHDSLRKALHAFAAAISAKASEVQGEKEQFYCPGCEHCHRVGLEKEFGKQPTPELPQAVREKIKEIMETTQVYGKSLAWFDLGLRYGAGFNKVLEDLCHLCLSMRAK